MDVCMQKIPWNMPNAPCMMYVPKIISQTGLFWVHMLGHIPYTEHWDWRMAYDQILTAETQKTLTSSHV